jgi:hypothetical protein
MMQEHCDMRGHDTPFTASNYGLTTTPEREYKITTGQMDCPAHDMLDKKGRSVRIIKHVEQLKTLPAALKAGLGVAEIIAVVRNVTLFALHCAVSLAHTREG